MLEKNSQQEPQEIEFYIDTETSKVLINSQTDQMSLLRYYYSLDKYGDLIENTQKEIIELLWNPSIEWEHQDILDLEEHIQDLEKVLQQIWEQQTQLLELIQLQ